MPSLPPEQPIAASTRKAPPGAARVPCQYSDISNETPGPSSILTAQHRRSAHILSLSVWRLAQLHGIGRMGFLTLTFRDHVLDPAEAQRRLNSLLTGVIKPRYQEYLGVMERQRSGRIHYHLLVVLPVDIRQGVDFGALASGDYRSASPALRAEWSFWRKTAPLYGFGRTELLPVKTDAAAIAFYVGKYISKHIDQRQEADKGVRLVRYSKGARAGTTRFQFVSPGSAQWRLKVARFAQIVEATFGMKVESLDDIKRHLGPRWAYQWRELIMGLEVDAPAGDSMGAGTAPGCACGAALGNNTESAAALVEPTESTPSIDNDFNNLSMRPGSILYESLFSSFKPPSGESLSVDGAPQDTLPGGVRGCPSPRTPAQRRAPIFSRP